MTTSYYPTKRRSLSRPRDGRVIGGVIAIASCLLPGPQVLAYVALWVIMPEDD